jgi:hypothetical protein
MSNASFVDAMSVLSVLTTVPMDHVCHGPSIFAVVYGTRRLVPGKKGETHIEETDFKQLVSRHVKLAF